MNVLRKYGVLLTAVISISVAAMVFTNVVSSADNAALYLKDLYGERAGLGGAEISGSLQDAYHSIDFDVSGGVLKKQTRHSGHYGSTIPTLYTNGLSKVIDGTEYELRLDFSSGTVIANVKYIGRPSGKRYKRYSQGAASCETGIACDKYTGNGYSLTNNDKYAMTKAGGRFYFTIPTTRDYTGTNGIFEVVSFTDNMDILTAGAKTAGSISLLAALSLEENKDSSAPGIEVLGLEAAGDKLVLVFTTGNTLRFRAYDSASGKQLGEVSVENMRIGRYGGSHGNSDQAELPGYLEHYEAFPDSNSICFSFIKNVPGINERTLIALDVSEEIRLAQKIDERYPEGEVDKISDVAVKNGMVYAAVLLREYGDSSRIPFAFIRPKQLLLYAYDSTGLTYKGELVSDMNDDNIFQLKAIAGGISYDPYMYRHFNQMNIR